VAADPQEKSFVCPECGGTEAAVHLRVIPASTDTSPWGQVHAREVCTSCRRVVPTSLAERWNGMTLEEAREIWHRLFREHPQSDPLSAEIWRRFVGEPNDRA
jgi:predicted RNA-binding Zn-ribbon protein involved in translation (DUF1610 family)